MLARLDEDGGLQIEINNDANFERQVLGLTSEACSGSLLCEQGPRRCSSSCFVNQEQKVSNTYADKHLS